MVAAEVGEDRDVEDDAVDPAHHQRVAGDLHRAGRRRRARASPRTAPCRSGASGVVSAVFTSSPADPGADGADHRRRRRRPPRSAGLGEPGGGGLALGAGDADHPQRARPGRRTARRRGRRAAARGRLDDEHGHRRRPASSAAPSASVSTATAPRGDRLRRRTTPRGRGRPGRAAYRSPGGTRCELERDAGDDRRRSPAPAARGARRGRAAATRGGSAGRVAGARVGTGQPCRHVAPTTAAEAIHRPVTGRDHRSGRSVLDRERRRLGAGRRHGVAAQHVAHDLAERRAGRPSRRRRRCGGSAPRRRR